MTNLDISMAKHRAQQTVDERNCEFLKTLKDNKIPFDYLDHWNAIQVKRQYYDITIFKGYSIEYIDSTMIVYLESINT